MMTITPFTTFNSNYRKPFHHTYETPVYDETDLVGDFDDDEYINELFLSIHGTIFFTMDNQDDRSFLLEDENDFSNDLFYTYFVL